MARKKSANKKQPTVRVGDISDISGNVNVAAGNINAHHMTVGAQETRTVFLDIYRDIDGLDTSSASKEDMKAEVKEIETAVTEAARKNEKVDEGFIARRFRNLARMAPDMLDVIAAMLASPLAGLGVAAKKIAEKAREEVK
jgi:hypothetical protein